MIYRAQINYLFHPNISADLSGAHYHMPLSREYNVLHNKLAQSPLFPILQCACQIKALRIFKILLLHSESPRSSTSHDVTFFRKSHPTIFIKPSSDGAKEKINYIRSLQSRAVRPLN